MQYLEGLTALSNEFDDMYDKWKTISQSCGASDVALHAICEEIAVQRAELNRYAI